jgi:hypothetical protein
MLTDLDAELFPDDCEVVEIPPHNRCIYLIQKNGSSSLRQDAEAKGWQIRRNEDLRTLKFVDVYLRDPAERYLSGVNTFVQHLMRDHVNLDSRTCEILATKYLFLNRHYLPQWHWLLNLARFLDPGCEIRFHSLDNLSLVTQRKSRAGVDLLPMGKATEWLYNNNKLEFWFLLDQILLGYCGQSLVWNEIIKIYQQHPAQPIKAIQDRIEAVRNVLC